MSAALTSRQVVVITTAVVLGRRWAHVLADFEQELVREVGARFVQHGRGACVTDLEWPVIEAARAAMWEASIACLQGAAA